MGSKVAKVIGPPGTGKTAYLMKQVERAAQKYGAENVGAVSYTKAATEEIKSRAAQSSGAALDSIPNIRTIHSHCFKLLDLKMDQVADKHVKGFNEAFPQFAVPLSIDEHREDDPNLEIMDDWSLQDNKKRFNLSQQLRKQMVPETEWTDESTVAWNTAWKRWMYVEGLIDFTGMIEQAVARGLFPEIAVLFVDEAQDLAPLELRLMEQWSVNVENTIYVGDSDQCIYRWAGAVPEAFIRLQHDFSTVLKQSYRVPITVHEYANRIIAQALDREVVTWEPTVVEGSVGLELAPNLELPGSHMILTRCNYMLTEWRKWLIREGRAWCNPYRAEGGLNPFDTKSWKAVRTYQALKGGLEVSGSDIKGMVGCMSTKDGYLLQGAKTWILDQWTAKRGDRFDLFGISQFGFTERFLEMKAPFSDVLHTTGQAKDILETLSEEKLMEPPSIILGTCHSVKGGEADHVWLDSRTSSQIMRATRQDDTVLYDEARVAYVAATRARQSFHVIRKQGLLNPLLP